MISSNATEFGPSDGRRFAFPVGAAFLVLAGVLAWRDQEAGFRALATVGVLLWSAGLLVPGRLGPVYRGWMTMALAISKVTTPIFMGVVYFMVLTPTGLVMRLLGRQPVRHDPSDGSFWRSTRGRSDLTRQF